MSPPPDAQHPSPAGGAAGADRAPRAGGCLLARADLEAYEATLAGAEKALPGGDPAPARQRAEEVPREAEAIAADVAQARRKTLQT